MSARAKARQGRRLWDVFRHVGGNAAILFAFFTPVVFVAVGATIDLSGAYNAERGLQEALDAAGIAAARQSATATSEAMKATTEAYFFHNVGESRRPDTRVIYRGLTKKNGYQVLALGAEREYDTLFGPTLKTLTNGAIDWSPFKIGVETEIIIENRSIEMALVLDNSGSMKWGAGTTVDAAVGNRKLDTLITAASDLVTSLMAVNAKSVGPPPTKISVVPFSSAVKVGSETINESWVDRYGDSSIHHENLDWSVWKDASGNALAKKDGHRWVTVADETPLTRQWLYDNARILEPGPLVKKRVCSWFFCYDTWVAGDPVPGARMFASGWSGCFEARPGGMAIDDTAPGSGDTLFVPMFAPDEYDNYDASNSYLDDAGDGKSGFAAIRVQSDVNKYLKATSAPTLGDGEGPNQSCLTQKILPLTANQATVETALKGMVANGSTNIPEGVAWGLRVLSPGVPFTEGKPYSESANLKAIVLMTDGENTYYPSYVASGLPVETYTENKSTWGTYGYGQVWSSGGAPRAGRIFDGTSVSKVSNTTGYKAAMDDLTRKACKNAKDSGRRPDGSDGIVIFTIAFDVPDGSAVKSILKDCASYGLVDPTKKLYYDAKDNAQLIAAFGKITEEVTNLRVAR